MAAHARPSARPAAADLVAIADHVGLERVALVGHSMGGFVVSETAARYPERVASVLLVDGGRPLPVRPGVGLIGPDGHSR